MLLDGEIEAMESTLNNVEFSIKESNRDDVIKTVLQLSIVPNYTGKIYAKNNCKGYTTELRRLPALELMIGVTKAYPSIEAPYIKVQSRFYA